VVAGGASRGAAAGPRREAGAGPPDAPTASLVLETPPDFGFDATVRSHGWYDLPPFRYEERAGVLETAVGDDGGAASRLTLSSDDPERPGAPLRVRVRGPLARERDAALRAARSMLQLDRDLAPLRAAIGRARGAERLALSWVERRGAGRLLRAPGAFEDAVKVLCTTNTTWSGTRAMVERLVSLGPDAPGGDGLRAFPAPEALARRSAAFLRERARMGYRAESLLALARAAARGDLAPEALRDPTATTDALRERILSLRGFGPYAADQLLRLAGRFDRPALDSWMRATWKRLHPRIREAGSTDAAILARYRRRYGAQSGLLLWLELTREWHEPAAAAPTPRA
jgi:N-glycosylase/DNA lyase